MKLWYLSHRRPSKAQASLHIPAISPETSLSAHMTYGSRRKVRPNRWPHWDEKYHNLLRWLILFHHVDSRILTKQTWAGQKMVVSVDRLIYMNCCMTKSTKWPVHPGETQISLGILCPVWSESSMSAWRNIGPLTTCWAHSEDWSDWADAQADLRLLWAYIILLVLSCGSSCNIWVWPEVVFICRWSLSTGIYITFVDGKNLKWSL